MSMNTSERDLREIFESYGRVSSVKIIMDRSTDRSRGFGFINFEERADAIKVSFFNIKSPSVLTWQYTYFCDNIESF